MSDVFLCHNSRDKPIVRRLGELLRNNGIDAWIDEVGLGPGCSWRNELEQALLDSAAVVVCIGPNGLGDWQEHEVTIAVRRRIKAGKTVFALVLPNCEDEPEIPLFLDTVQCLYLARDQYGPDPFGRLLQAVDGRDPNGHYRPAIVVLRNSNEPTSQPAELEVVSNCRSQLFRVRILDYADVELDKKLAELSPKTDVLVSLLAPDSFKPRSNNLFPDGIAAKAAEVARENRVLMIQWRDSEMPLPESAHTRARFQNPDEVETCQPFDLARIVVKEAPAKFRFPTPPDESMSQDKKKSILGLPPNGNAFAGTIADIMKRHDIRCDSQTKWERILRRLKHRSADYDALIVILTGDRDWRDQCEEWLDELDLEYPECLPEIGAYCHQVEDRSDAAPVPLDLPQFDRYFGRSDLPKLALRIRETGRDNEEESP